MSGDITTVPCNEPRPVHNLFALHFFSTRFIFAINPLGVPQDYELNVKNFLMMLGTVVKNFTEILYEDCYEIYLHSFKIHNTISDKNEH
jgi:hypothetical protein